VRAVAAKPASKQPAERKREAQLAYGVSMPAPLTGATGKRSCTCGGGCPRCRKSPALQPKLDVSEPGDSFEREADRVADAAMRTGDPAASAEYLDEGAPTSGARPRGSASARRARVAASGTPGTRAPTGTPGLEGEGRALARAEREFFGSRMGRDFGHVRIHAGDRAAAAARSLHARAFTVGNDVVFGPGEYAPHTHAGRRLLAHELAHTVQQRENRQAQHIQRTISVDNPGDTPPPNTMNNGALVVSLFNQLCPDIPWQLNGSNVQPVNATDCSAASLQTASAQTACTCACNFNNSAGPNIGIEVDPTSWDHTQASGGANSFHTVLTGRSDSTMRGIRGATAPASGTPLRSVPDPAWLILGHEMCGHAGATLPNMATATADELHQMTQAGNRTAVDIENRIRQQRDAASGTDLGIRIGEFQDLNDNVIAGSLVTLPRAMSLASLLLELEVPVRYTFLHEAAQSYFYPCTTLPSDEAALRQVRIVNRVVLTQRGDLAVPFDCVNNSFPPGTNFNIEGVFWHRSTGSQSKQQIAAQWGVTVRAINRANAVFANGVDSVAPTQALAAGTMVCIPYKSAPGSERYFMTSASP
jgi:hypothetical protein